jgi:hypothetical protein
MSVIPPEKIDFKHFTLPKTSNFFLFAPQGFCNVATEPQSPVFDCPVDKLEAYMKETISTLKRVKLRSFSEKNRRFHYTQTTWLCRFTDYIIVQYLPVDEKKSTILLYSYSQTGTFDLGANKMRVFKWMIALKHILQREGVL